MQKKTVNAFLKAVKKSGKEAVEKA